jgi:hypothetical protein
MRTMPVEVAVAGEVEETLGQEQSRKRHENKIQGAACT